MTAKTPRSTAAILGFPGRRPRNPVRRKPLAPLTRVPPAPDFLSDAARAEFDRAAALLVARRVLTDLDLTTLAAFADALARWHEAAAALKTEQTVITSKRSGVAHANPWFAIARVSRRDALKLGAEFGLTPSARGLDVSALDELPAKPGNGRNYFSDD